MSTSNSSNSSKTSSNGLWALFFLGWPLFGWVGDTPRNVDEDGGEAALATVAPWVSVVFHVAGAITASLAYPAWGLAWALFSGLILARRLCASGGQPVRLHMSSLPRVFALVPYGAATWALGVASVAAISTIWFHLPFPLSSAQDFAANFGPIALMGLMAYGAVQYKAEVLEERAAMLLWRSRLSKTFGVPESVIEAEGGVYLLDGGAIVHLSPVPAAVALSLRPSNRSTIEENIAAVAPSYMLDPNSGPDLAALIPVDDATRETRASLAVTGGLIGAPVTWTTPDAAPATLSISAEDLL